MTNNNDKDPSKLIARIEKTLMITDLERQALLRQALSKAAQATRTPHGFERDALISEARRLWDLAMGGDDR